MTEREGADAAARGDMDWLLGTMNRMLRCHTVRDLLDLAYDAIRDGLGYDRVGLDLLDVERHALVEYVGTDATGRKFFPQNRLFPLDEGAFYTRLLADPRLQIAGPGFIYVADATKAMPPHMRHVLDGQPTDNLIVSLRTAEKILGLVYVDNLVSGRPIGPDDAPPLVTFATALAMAVENVTLLQHNADRIRRLTAGLEQRIGQLEWLREMGRRVNAAQTLDEALDVVYDGIRDGLGYDRVGIVLFDHEQGLFDERRGTDAQGRKFVPRDRAVSLAKDSPVWELPDVAALLQGAEFYYTSDAFAETPEHLRYLLDGAPTQSLTVALHSGATASGLISVDNLLSGRPITADDAGPLLALANQVGMAVENARLHEQERSERAQLEMLLEQAAARAEQDALTGLLNHRAIVQRLDAALANETHCAFLLIDVDNFKLFNDTHGHLTGDAVLLVVAGILRDVCREDDVAARYGGDEFALLLHNVAADDAASVAHRLAGTVQTRTHTMPDGTIIPLSISVGWACYPTDGYTRQELVAVADRTMYEAKRRGGARFALDFTDGVYGAWPDTYLRDTPDMLGTSPFGVLEGLVTAVDAKDRYTREHSDDVTQLALILAEALELSDEERRVLAVAGPLHDVGKVAVPDRILRKPGKLTAEEYRIIKSHVSYGVAFIRGMLDDPAVLDAVAYHHERWDGQGYPYGVCGAETPLLGRIMQVADAVSAMMLDRPYRQGLPWRRVVSELRKGAGGQFDPALVDAFIAAVTRRDTAAS